MQFLHLGLTYVHFLGIEFFLSMATTLKQARKDKQN